MSGFPLTIPPPNDDDHEDVAWALRAAAAQWKRRAHGDAVQWVQRAAETAETVGNGARFTELCLLAASLERSLKSGSVAQGPPSFSSAPPTIQMEIVEIDFDEVEEDGGVELLDDDDEIEMLDEVEELDPVEVFAESSTRGPGNSRSSRPPAPRRSSAPPASDAPASSRRGPLSQAFPPSTRTASRPAPVSSSPPASAGRRASSPSSRSSSEPTTARSSSLSRGSSTSTRPSRPVSRSITSTRPMAGGVTATEGSSSRPPAARRKSSSPSSGKTTGSLVGDKRRSTTTSRRLDRLPPSMRPEPSGLDLAEEVQEMENDGYSSQPPYGELDFQDEGPTHRVDVPKSTPAPDLGPLHVTATTEIPFAEETPAEYAQSRHRAELDHEELERELGIDLNVPAGKISREQSIRPGWELAERTAPSSHPSGESGPPGVVTQSPIPGRASVVPSSLPWGAARVTSAETEPYGLAPSATLPPALELPASDLPGARWSSHAPPPDLMVGADERPSSLPAVGTRPPPSRPSVPAHVAPDLDEFEDMFDKLSMPPAKSDTEIPPLEPATLQRSEPPDLTFPASAPGEIVVDGVDFLELQGFQDLPVDAARALARTAELRTLRSNEEVSGFAVALVTHGAVRLMPTIADATCRIVRKGDVLFTKGTLERSAAVRVVGMEEGSRVAVFSAAALNAATSSCPWVADELADIADGYLAFAGAALGALGDSLDEMFRFMVLDKCGVKSKPEGAIIAEGGRPMDGLYVLGAGALELVGADGKVEQQLAMGDFVFPETILTGAPAARTVRVGPGGALMLYADRMTAHELLATCPPLIEILAG